VARASEAWVGLELVDYDGQKVGEVVDIYADDVSGEPKWLAVRTGLFGLRRNFVPTSEVTPEGDVLLVRCSKAHVAGSPTAEESGFLAPEEEVELFEHYGLHVGADDTLETAAPESPGRQTETLTRSEEEVRVSTTEQVAGTVRLRKWIETEPVVETVALKRDELRIERQPITETNVEEAMAGAEISEAEYEFVLREEQPVVSKVVVPKEHISVDTVEVTDQQEVTAEVRKERVDVERTDAP
jgi:stress response protein YsnF